MWGRGVRGQCDAFGGVSQGIKFHNINKAFGTSGIAPDKKDFDIRSKQEKFCLEERMWKHEDKWDE